MATKKEDTEHVLVPLHVLLTDAEAKKVLEELHLKSKEELPKIFESDPQAKKLGAKPGQIIKIYREDPPFQAKNKYFYYRLVIKG
ncbi:MAG: DNA-directed RNA polymerase subunit RpoH/Rpb5 C-terminal domain-containing protein [Candidatus Micrarchaeia archaeon]